MTKAISYSLFGFNQQKHHSCFDFISYMRGMLYSLRMNMLVYPDWKMIVQTDESTYKAYKALFDNLPIKVNVNEPAPLCKAMLWRLKPVFDYNSYTHVICRDLDSPPTYREAQAVQDWINGDKAAHAITDSISHTIPMMGGMVGFHTGLWPVRTGWQHWADMFKDQKIDFSIKGADQTLLNSIVYPKFATPPNESITQHYILGHGNTWLNGYKNYIPDIEVDNVSRDMNESNDCCSHIGQAGWLLPQAFRLFQKYADRFEDVLKVEKQFPEICYWVKDGTFE
jgi:hypothetical protein